MKHLSPPSSVDFKELLSIVSRQQDLIGTLLSSTDSGERKLAAKSLMTVTSLLEEVMSLLKDPNSKRSCSNATSSAPSLEHPPPETKNKSFAQAANGKFGRQNSKESMSMQCGKWQTQAEKDASSSKKSHATKKTHKVSSVRSGPMLKGGVDWSMVPDHSRHGPVVGN